MQLLGKYPLRITATHDESKWVVIGRHEMITEKLRSVTIGDMQIPFGKLNLPNGILTVEFVLVAPDVGVKCSERRFVRATFQGIDLSAFPAPIKVPTHIGQAIFDVLSR